MEPELLFTGGWQTGVKSDGWTVVMGDGSLSARFEKTTTITGEEAEMLVPYNQPVLN